MTYEEIVSEVAGSIGLNKRIVDKTYKAYWKAIREYVTSIPLSEDLSEEEFEKARPNINIPSLGKLYVAPDRYKRIRKSLHFRKEEKNNKYAAHQKN